MSRLDETRPFIPLNIAVLTVSDTRKLEEDRSGNTLVDRIEKAGHTLADRQIVEDASPHAAGYMQRKVHTPLGVQGHQLLWYPARCAI